MAKSRFSTPRNYAAPCTMMGVYLSTVYRFVVTCSSFWSFLCTTVYLHMLARSVWQLLNGRNILLRGELTKTSKNPIYVTTNLSNGSIGPYSRWDKLRFFLFWSNSLFGSSSYDSLHMWLYELLPFGCDKIGSSNLIERSAFVCFVIWSKVYFSVV